MNTVLGPLTFDEEWALRGLDAAPLAVETQRSDEGVLQILTAPMEGGRELELHGELTLAEEEQVLALIASATPVTLTHHRFSGTVLITGTAFEFADEIEYVNPLPTTIRVGSIYIIEV